MPKAKRECNSGICAKKSNEYLKFHRLQFGRTWRVTVFTRRGACWRPCCGHDLCAIICSV